MNIYIEKKAKKSSFEGIAEDLATTVFVAAFVGYVGFRIFFSLI